MGLTLTVTRVQELLRMHQAGTQGAEDELRGLLDTHRDAIAAMLGREQAPDPTDPAAIAKLGVRLGYAVRRRRTSAQRAGRAAAEVLALRLASGTRAQGDALALPIPWLLELVQLRGYDDLVFVHGGTHGAVNRRFLCAILRGLEDVSIESALVGDTSDLRIHYATRMSRGRFRLQLAPPSPQREHVAVDLDAVCPSTPGMLAPIPIDRVRPTLTPALDRRSA